jgi:hypothetical protein
LDFGKDDSASTSSDQSIASKKRQSAQRMLHHRRYEPPEYLRCGALLQVGQHLIASPRGRRLFSRPSHTDVARQLRRRSWLPRLHRALMPTAIVGRTRSGSSQGGVKPPIHDGDLVIPPTTAGFGTTRSPDRPLPFCAGHADEWAKERRHQPRFLGCANNQPEQHACRESQSETRQIPNRTASSTGSLTTHNSVGGQRRERPDEYQRDAR